MGMRQSKYTDEEKSDINRNLLLHYDVIAFHNAPFPNIQIRIIELIYLMFYIFEN